MLRTVLIHHSGAGLDGSGLAWWLASFSDVAGVVVIAEPPRRLRQRIRREIRRVGPVRFLDVLAFRLYYRLVCSGRDRAWQEQALEELRMRFGPRTRQPPTITVTSPNHADAKAFLEGLQPDIVIARCKTLLKPEVFGIPRTGTFVMHPGICPEYRNAHGCFWALARDDIERVGMTLLKIDQGVDTGPVFGYYTYPFDERAESHIVIQHRVVLENLDGIRDTLIEIHDGKAKSIDTSGRASYTWGQPWLTAYLRWKRKARKRRP